MELEDELIRLREVLAATDGTIEDPFGVLYSISLLVNKQKTHHLGREMVIRALAVQDFFPADHKAILQSLVTSVGLLPYLDRESEIDLHDQILIEAHRPPLDEPNLLFHTLQLQIYRDLISGRNVVLSASTSVGKSLVVDAVVASGKYHHIAIIVPTIALIDETRRRLTKRFGLNFDIVTHPTQQANRVRPTIFVLTQERALSRNDMDEVTFFVIDEFYKIDLTRDRTDRTVDLNLCFHRFAKAGAQFYLIGPNIDGVTGLGGEYEFTFIPSQFSTVALDFVEFNLPKDHEIRRDKLLGILESLDTPSLVYCQSPASVAKVAEFLISSGRFSESALTDDAVTWLMSEFPEEWVFIKALQVGIGIHHGNIPRALQQYIVRAFDRGLIKIILCTSTIIEGVNTIAENVIIYDRRSGARGTPTLDNFTFKNISGRAGRMKKYFIGKVFVLEARPPDEDSYSVQIGVENQDELTPLSLLIDLEDDDLKPLSRQRLNDVAFESPLSLGTLRLNRHVPFEDQNAVHQFISRDLVMLEDALVWRGVPTSHQLLAVCEIIYELVDCGRTLGRHGIASGRGLRAELNRLRMNSSFEPTIEYWIENKRYGGTVSDAVESALRFMRRYVGFTFSRQLMAVSNIQAEIYRNAGRKHYGDYSLFAAQAENLFMEAGLFALDEFGVPPELSRKLGRDAGEVRTLIDGINILKNVDLTSEDLHPFEREILKDVLNSFG